MIHKILGIVFPVLVVWCLALVVHFLWEALWLFTNGLAPLAPCHHWWCPQTWARKIKRSGE